jgi:hypothetical protein
MIITVYVRSSVAPSMKNSVATPLARKTRAIDHEGDDPQHALLGLFGPRASQCASASMMICYKSSQ